MKALPGRWNATTTWSSVGGLPVTLAHHNGGADFFLDQNHAQMEAASVRHPAQLLAFLSCGSPEHLSWQLLNGPAVAPGLL